VFLTAPAVFRRCPIPSIQTGSVFQRHGDTDELFLCIRRLMPLLWALRAPGGNRATARLALQHGFRHYRGSDDVRWPNEARGKIISSMINT
jgi:hypothetical protein